MKDKDKIFDDTFKTLLEKCTKLIIPVINEVFKTDYDMNEKIEMLSSEQHFKGTDGKSQTRIMDSIVKIRDHMYHIECQSYKDDSMSIRMIEYDFHTAINNAERIDGKDVLEFPESAVLYVREFDLPQEHQIVIKFPKNQEVPDVTVSIPIIKLQKYSKDEIFDKKLLMFIPFYILRFEKRISKIENDMQELSELKKEYDYIYSSLKKLNENKYIDDVYLMNLVDLTQRLAEYVADNSPKVKEEVVCMGGNVLELLSDKLLEEGRVEGRVEGREEERAEILFRMMKTGNISYFQACNICGFSNVEKNKYMESVMKKLEQEGYDLNGNQISNKSNNIRKNKKQSI